MEAFYEESALNKKELSDKRIYQILHIVSMIFLSVAVVLFVAFLFNFPWIAPTVEDQALQIIFGIIGILSLLSFLTSFFFTKLKKRFIVSYDYCFVSGELRISKVFNIAHRRLVARIDCEDMIQIGDVDNPSYERFKADPTIKKVICTPNEDPADGKFFMYVLASYNEKTLFLLECRENLLLNIMKFAKRSVLESDYVMQDKKQK